MHSSIVIDQAAAGSCRPLLCSGSRSRSRSWYYGGLSMLVVMSVLVGRPDLAFAQYPGFSSDAGSASVSADAVDAPSGGSGDDASANSGGTSSASSYAGAGAGSAASSNRSDGGEDHSQTASNGFGAATNRTKARQSRDYYFVRKLRVEFAAMELVERRTGMAFSRHNVPRYLDELRAELAKMQGSAGAPVQSLAHDVQHIDTELNKHIDKLLAMIGTPTNAVQSFVPSFVYGFLTPNPPLPKTPDAAAAKMASISLKYELMDFGEKALQAMGAGYR
ncbi:hypothetical protein N9L23_02420 [Alphaproteobacteria bacterium]|nr:hypothetical protein [Alphaproteobacteria bacterium]